MIADRTRHVLGTLAGVVVAAAMIGPRAMPFFVLAVAICAALNSDKSVFRNFTPPGGLAGQALFASLVLYVFINASWSLIPQAAFGKALLLATTVAVMFGLIYWINTVERDVRERMRLGVIVGFAVGAGYLFIEVLSEQAIMRGIFNTFTFLRPSSSKHVIIVGGEIEQIYQYVINRNVAVFNMLLWPAMLAAISVLDGKWRRLSIGGFLLACIVATLMSEHETSKVALPIGILVFLAARLKPVWTGWLVKCSWVCVWLMIVPLALYAYGNDYHKSDLLQDTARARIIFWGLTAEKVLEQPVLGIGVNSTREYDRRNKIFAKQLDGQIVSLRTGRHAHNWYLQTWFELGAVGAILSMLCGLMLLKRLETLQEVPRAYGFAAFAVAMAVAAFSWGMWQAWFIASFAMVLFVFNVVIPDRPERDA